jgi:hypothetical protein
MESDSGQRWRKLLSWRSVPVLLLGEEGLTGGALSKLLWRLLENIHTTLWLVEECRKFGSRIPPWLKSPMTIHWAMFIVGLSWLSVVVWGDRIVTLWGGHPANEITAEFIQSKMFGSHWVTPIAMDLLEKMGRPNEVFEFDVLYEIYVVNRGREITVKSLRAEAEVEPKTWMRLRQIPDLDDYELKTEKSIPGRVGGEIIKKTYRKLDNFMEKTSDGLKTRIGYRGFVRFRFEATKKQVEAPVNTKLWIIDALGNEHVVLVSNANDIGPSEGEITYSRKHLEI